MPSKSSPLLNGIRLTLAEALTLAGIMHARGLEDVLVEDVSHRITQLGLAVRERGGKCASLHAQVGELVERNTALEQELSDMRNPAPVQLPPPPEEPDDTPEDVAPRTTIERVTDTLGEVTVELARAQREAEGWRRTAVALEQEVCDLKMGALTHSAEAQDDVLREVERWRLASESLEQQLLQARAELLRYRALVDGFARELGEAMLKRALEVRT